MAPKSLNTTYISYLAGHYICFILDRGGEVNKKKERRGGNVGSSTIDFNECDFITTLYTSKSLGDSRETPKLYIRNCTTQNKSGPMLRSSYVFNSADNLSVCSSDYYFMVAERGSIH